MTSKDPKPPNVSEMFKEVLDALQASTNLEEVREPADVEALTREMEETMNQLNQKAEELYAATGMSREELQEFSAHKENFTEEEWRLLNDVRAQVDQFQKNAQQIMEEGLHQLDMPDASPPTQATRKKTKKKGPTSRVKRKDWMGG